LLSPQLVISYIEEQTVLNSTVANHWPNDVKPDDYQSVLESVQTRFWVDKFHSNYKKIVIPNKHLRWLKSAATIGCQTGKLPLMYNEELDDLTDR
jgi:hypothetical protein